MPKVLCQLALALALTQAAAQPSARPAAEPGRPVEPGVGDRPMGAGGRVLPGDLRLPTGFERLYETPDGFVRQDGALQAVFPRSLYVNTRFGPMPVIPPGTVFRIGTAAAGPPPSVPGDAAMPVDRSASRPAARPAAERPGAAPGPAPAAPERASSFFDDEQARRGRVAALLRDAAAR